MNGRCVTGRGSYPAALARWTPPAGSTSAWSTREPALSGLDLAGLTATLLDPATSHRRRDDLLAALIRLAVDDPDATTAVVVCLLPGLRRMARRLEVGPTERAELWAELIGQTVVHVRGYDLTRRPRRIAANLLLDAMSHTLTYLRREAVWQSRTEPLDTAELPPAAEPDGGDLLDLAVKQHVVTSSDAALIRSSRLDGYSLREAGARQGLTYEAARKRRQRSEAMIRRWLKNLEN